MVKEVSVFWCEETNNLVEGLQAGCLVNRTHVSYVFQEEFDFTMSSSALWHCEPKVGKMDCGMNITEA